MRAQALEALEALELLRQLPLLRLQHLLQRPQRLQVPRLLLLHLQVRPHRQQWLVQRLAQRQAQEQALGAGHHQQRRVGVGVSRALPTLRLLPRPLLLLALLLLRLLLYQHALHHTRQTLLRSLRPAPAPAPAPVLGQLRLLVLLLLQWARVHSVHSSSAPSLPGSSWVAALLLWLLPMPQSLLTSLRQRLLRLQRGSTPTRPRVAVSA